MKRRWVSCLVCIIAVLLIRVSDATAAERLQLQAIRLAEQGATTHIELQLSQSADFKMFTLTGPDRVVLDISAAALGRTALPLPGAVGVVRDIRAAHRDGDLRIVFDLGVAMRPQSKIVGEGSAARLLIDLQPVTSVPGTVPVAASLPAVVPEPEPEPSSPSRYP